MNLEAWSLSEAQDVVARARARGLCVIGNLSANRTGTHWADPPDHQAWAANAASGFVTPLKGDVNVWEIWNEPNLSGFWPSTSESYADLLHQTYLAIKAADADAVVLGAGECLQEARRPSVEMGAAPLSERIARLAQRGRVALHELDGADAPEASVASDLGLTPPRGEGARPTRRQSDGSRDRRAAVDQQEEADRTGVGLAF
jgi:hypothetical protein